MTHQVTIAGTGLRFEVETDETVLEAAMRQDIVLMHDCTYGGCGTCRIRLLEGAVDYEEWPFALAEDEAAAGHALACQARPKGDLVIGARLRPEGWIAPDLYLATVAGIDLLSHDVAHLTLSVPEAAEIAYHPGQYLNVMLDDGAPRSFSMASPPAAGVFDFHIRRVPGGRFTDSLFGGVSVGDELEVELPHGEFRFRSEPGRGVLMVAGGTGLAPIKCILEAQAAADALPETLLYWGRPVDPRPLSPRPAGGPGAGPAATDLRSRAVDPGRRLGRADRLRPRGGGPGFRQPARPGRLSVRAAADDRRRAHRLRRPRPPDRAHLRRQLQLHP